MTPSAKTADLHLHTFFSDGTDSPQRVVELAKAAGLSAIAITDHDNTGALAQARPHAARVGLELIPGIEMSSSAYQREVHMLGLFIDVNHPGLQAHLADQQARRIQRVHEMVQRLGQVGVTIDAAEVLALAKEGTVGRPHVAEILLRHGYVSTRAEAFDRYIGPKDPGFVPGSTLSPTVVIRMIRDAGGIPVLAHPVYVKHDALIEELVPQGLAGLEVYHSGHAPDVVRHYERVAERLHLLRTGGSDYHGESKEGLPVGSVAIPYALVEALKSWNGQPRSV